MPEVESNSRPCAGKRAALFHLNSCQSRAVKFAGELKLFLTKPYISIKNLCLGGEEKSGYAQVVFEHSRNSIKAII